MRAMACDDGDDRADAAGDVGCERWGARGECGGGCRGCSAGDSGGRPPPLLAAAAWACEALAWCSMPPTGECARKAKEEEEEEEDADADGLS